MSTSALCLANMASSRGKRSRTRLRPMISIVYLVQSMMLSCAAQQSSTLSLSPLVLEEVVEHGPLFDELEDEAWWSGVEIIDTALRPSLDTIRVKTDEDFCSLWDSPEACFEASPGDLGSPVQPPRMPPPPPVPPFMGDLIQQVSTPSDSNNEDCLLCQWAVLNGTLDLLPAAESSTGNTWIPMLVVVALVSAMVGAILMIAALKCRRFKVLPRGGSCPTLPIGYVVSDSKDSQNGSSMSSQEPSVKNYSLTPDGSSSLGRPRLNTPTPQVSESPTKLGPTSTTGWRIKLWRKMTNRGGSSATILDDLSNRDDHYTGDNVSAVYAELNSIVGANPSRARDSVATYQPYHLNTYSEIHDPQTALGGPARSLHLRKLLGDGTYENAAYAMERGVLEPQTDSSSGCASTPSSAYYSDLSNSDRSGSQQPWNRLGKRMAGESHSLPHCRHARHSNDSCVHGRDLMPVTLEVIPDNQQVLCDLHGPGVPDPCGSSFSRGGVSASLETNKRPLPPLPSRQLQRPQRRYAYATSNALLSAQVLPPCGELPVACVPSEYV